jgi:DNA-binding NarL/FixJ family response regulator
MLGGGIHVGERIARRVLERIGSDETDPGARLGTLTDRELDVFDLSGRGTDSGTIAVPLQVSFQDDRDIPLEHQDKTASRERR